MRKLTITEQEAGSRLDKYIGKYLEKASKGFLYKGLRKKNIKLNGKKAEGSELLKAGDEICLYFSEETFALMTEHPAPGEAAAAPALHFPKGKKLADYCSIVWEDEGTIIADKHAGVLSQKAAASDFSLNEALLCYTLAKRTDVSALSTESEETGLYTPSVCNRLDRNTSGLVCFAKTYAAAREWNRLLKERDLGKFYLAVVRGNVQKPAHRKGWIIKDEQTNQVRILEEAGEGASAIETSWRPLMKGADGETTVLEVELHTGKTHQIRAHLASEGYPIVGDPKYGAAQSRRGKGEHRQLLHAWRLSLPEELGEPLKELAGKSILAGIPEDFQPYIRGRESILEEAAGRR